MDIWDQSPLLLGGERITATKGGWGGAVRGTFYYRFSKERSLLHFTAQIGYKTGGSLEGEQLAGGIILRIGISFFGL